MPFPKVVCHPWPFTRRFLLLALAAATLSATSAKEASCQETRPPNIIFILADDLGYGDLGCYGQKRIQTPHLDRMARQGMRFTDCYAGSTVCAPSRCCLMTGLHTGHARVRGNARVPLREEDVTVAEKLHEAGYRTGLIGKWGLGEPDTSGIPNRQGFDLFFGYLNQRHAHNYYPEFLWHNQRKALLGNEVAHVLKGRDVTPGGVAVKRVDYSHDIFTKEALDFVDRNRRRPFFLYLAYTIPHANNEAGRAGKEVKIPEYQGMEVPDFGPYAQKDWPGPQKGHAAMITRMDRDVGRLLERLGELGIDRDTMVFFSSDNGPHKEGGADPAFFESSGPLRGYKRSLHDGGIRVPMIARWPGHIQPDTTSDLPCAFWDFLPTACQLAGVAVPEGLDGISLVPELLASGDQPKHDFLYWEFHEGRGSSQAVRMGPWKAVRKRLDAPLELYDLREDPGEQHDVASAHPDVVAKIETYLKTARTESEPWPLRPWKTRKK